MKLFAPQDAEGVRMVLDFIGSKVNDFDQDKASACLATIDADQNRIIGAAAYQNYRMTDIEMVSAGEPGWLSSRSIIRAYFAYPFVQLGCRRVTVVCHRKNKRSRAFVERLGFRLEGVHREAMPDGKDAISYGMLRRECRWLESVS